MPTKNTKQTSPKIASLASAILRSKTATKKQKSVAASDLAQAHHKAKIALIKHKHNLK